jgi:cytochrome c-type biogenesis protein CcmH
VPDCRLPTVDSRLLAVLAMACLLLAARPVAARPVAAQTPEPPAPGAAADVDDAVHDIAKSMNCPTCAGRNLADCPTDTCAQWKAEIRSQLLNGKSRQEVLAYFQDRFGPTVLQEPPKEGAVLALWVTPVIAAAALVMAGVWIARRTTRRAAPPPPPPPAAGAEPAADSYAAQLEEQVRQE